MCTDHNIATRVDGDVLTVEVVGQLALSALPCFRAALRIVDRQAFATVVIDGSRLQSVDAAGLGMLIGSYRRLCQRGIDVRLTDATGSVRRLLELLGFDRCAGLCEPEGLTSLRAGASLLRSSTDFAGRKIAANF